ncbi:hypothetical protein R1flu_024671 [Riccia fluitans]|uniref:ATP synthase protein MI25 n=1 Tax=Riccia fluitans TaxID=41844 RepID=A0ABD1XVK1_9MARC
MSSAVTQLLSSLKEESSSLLHKIRSSCLEALDIIRKQSTSVLDGIKEASSGLAIRGPTYESCTVSLGFLTPVERHVLEHLITSALRPGTITASCSFAVQQRDHWQQLRMDEIDLHEKRIELTIKHLQLVRMEFQE